MIYPSLLPPSSTDLEKALEQVAFALTDLPTPVRDIWSPDTCPVALLPWLGWGLSVDVWDSNWSEAQKRAAVADAIAFQRRKGTPASLRTVLDRFDPLIEMVEWFDDRANLPPHTFRLELPTNLETQVIYDEALITQILRDIATVKPVRSQMSAVHRLRADAETWLVSGASLAGYGRLTPAADVASALDPSWLNNLQTEDGEPILDGDNSFLETA